MIVDRSNQRKHLLSAGGNRGRKVKQWTEDHRLSSH